MDALYTGKVITEHRKELGLTQKELADKLGVTDKAVSRWENGMNFPDIALMDSLAQTLTFLWLNFWVLRMTPGRKLSQALPESQNRRKRKQSI